MKSKDLAAALGISASYYSEIERGKKSVPSEGEFLRRFATALGISYAELTPAGIARVRARARGRSAIGRAGGDPDLRSIRDAAGDLRTDSENMIREALRAAKLLEPSHLETSQKLDSYAKLLKRSSGAASGWLKALEELYAIHSENLDQADD